jgi:hypothetical protein
MHANAVNGCCAECFVAIAFQIFQQIRHILKGRRCRNLKTHQISEVANLLPARMSFAKLTIFALGRKPCEDMRPEDTSFLEILG